MCGVARGCQEGHGGVAPSTRCGTTLRPACGRGSPMCAGRHATARATPAAASATSARRRAARRRAARRRRRPAWRCARTLCSSKLCSSVLCLPTACPTACPMLCPRMLAAERRARLWQARAVLAPCWRAALVARHSSAGWRQLGSPPPPHRRPYHSAPAARQRPSSLAPPDSAAYPPCPAPAGRSLLPAGQRRYDLVRYNRRAWAGIIGGVSASPRHPRGEGASPPLLLGPEHLTLTLTLTSG